jgi:hypothetical protein
MKPENIFYSVFILTIIIIRISIILVPEVDIEFFGIIIHHFYLGLFLILFGLVVPKQKLSFKILIYGIGMGLLFDQLIFIILGAGKDKEYWAPFSLYSTIIFSLILYPFRKKLINLLLK